VTVAPALDKLPRSTLLAVAFEHMLAGMIVTRATLPQVILRGGDLALMNQVAIEEWMGASPVYTRRMRALMGIEGDDVGAIMKALQLDCGFVHQYMDVGYRLIDRDHAEFWLAHCGALMDTEPHGEEQVFGMCHTIEDPTFDATALATNPRARIRPIHRPPRSPADRHPHCRWTITIDDANEPVGSVPLTDRVAALPLAAVPNPPPSDAEGAGRRDYSGPFDPGFRLADLSSSALAGAAREFQVQAHLLMCSSELTLRDHFDADVARDVVGDAWAGAGWIGSERTARALAATGAAADLATVLAVHPMLPPGFTTRVEDDGDRLRLELRPAAAELLDPEHPGWCGALARGDARGLAGMIHGVDRHAEPGQLAVDDGAARVDVIRDATADPAPEPDIVSLVRIGMVSTWDFDRADPVAAPTRR
jgi:hypothetical protein